MKTTHETVGATLLFCGAFLMIYAPTDTARRREILDAARAHGAKAKPLALDSHRYGAVLVERQDQKELV